MNRIATLAKSIWDLLGVIPGDVGVGAAVAPVVARFWAVVVGPLKIMPFDVTACASAMASGIRAASVTNGSGASYIFTGCGTLRR